MAELRIENMLEEVVKLEATDLHITAGAAPMIRIDGFLKPISDKAQPLTEQEAENLIYSVIDENQKKTLKEDKEIDFSFAFGDVARFRANAYHQKGNLALSLRYIPTKIRTIDELGLPPTLNKFTEYPRGLVLVTGPTGSGKSTTLAAMIDKINTDKRVHIITIEDPIEYTFTNKKALIDQREVYYDTRSFATSLRSVLREDPDVVMVGEMRDLETIASAITIAETGHLVLATLHTNTAAQTMDRIIDVFPPYQQPQIRVQLAHILQGVVSQRLIPAIGGGRVAVAEIMVTTPAVKNIIREGKTHQLDAVIQTSADKDMITMDKALVNLVKLGQITSDEAHNYAVDPTELEKLLHG